MSTTMIPPTGYAEPEPPAKKKYEWQFVPPIGAPEEDVKAFVDAVINDKGRFRRWSMLRMARNLWFYKDRHWFEIPKELHSGSGGYKFKDIRPRGMSSSEVPPQDNRIALGVDNEVARLVAREVEPSVTAERPDPRLESAAKLTRDILIHDITKIHWPKTRQALAFDMTVGGTATGCAYWDETATDLTVVASPTASICPSCQQKFASTTISADFVRQGIPMGQDQGLAPFLHAETVKALPNYPGNRVAQMTHCPMCDDISPLTGYEPTEDEAKGQELDIFGSPLGLAVPRGEGFLNVVDQFGLFPQDGGHVEPQDCTIMGVRSIKELEWIAPRIPEDMAGDLSPENSRDLAKLSPTLEGPGGGDPDSFKHHAFLDEVYVQPMDLPGLEMGRRIWRVGDKIVHDDALMVPVQTPANGKVAGKTKKVARWRSHTARYVSVRREFWGRTPTDRAVPHNRRLNKILYMMDELRGRGFPWIAVPRGVEIIERDETNGVLRYTEIDASGSNNPNWTPKDNIVNSNPITGNNYLAEHDRCIAAIEALLGPKPTEAGINQPGVKSGDQAELLAEEAKQKRVPQEQELNHLHEALWTAHMEQTWAFRKESAEYEVEGAADQRERESYRGTDLLGQVNVKVESTGKMERSLAQASKAVKAVEMGLVDIQTDELAKQKMLEMLDLPTTLNENRSIQVRRAEQAFSEFDREQRIPVFDPAIQEPGIWYQTLGQRWQGDDMQRKQRLADWDDVVKAIAGWQEQLATAEAMDTQAKAVYQGIDPALWKQTFEEYTAKAMAVEGAQPPVAPPPDGKFLPASLADRLLLLWERMAPQLFAPVAVMGAPVLTEQDEAQQSLIQFYAVIQQCKLEAERKVGAFNAGAPVIAAPGGAQPGMEAVPPVPGMAA